MKFSPAESWITLRKALLCIYQYIRSRLCSCSNKTRSQFSPPCHDVPKSSLALPLCLDCSLGTLPVGIAHRWHSIGCLLRIHVVTVRSQGTDELLVQCMNSWIAGTGDAVSPSGQRVQMTVRLRSQPGPRGSSPPSSLQ